MGRTREDTPAALATLMVWRKVCAVAPLRENVTPYGYFQR